MPGRSPVARMEARPTPGRRSARSTRRRKRIRMATTLSSAARDDEQAAPGRVPG
ncbi:DNA-binding response regulator, partial [Clavibacter nebraskensis]